MKTLKFLATRVIVLLLFLTFVNEGYTQRPGLESPKQREKIEAHKIAFITNQLQLTPQEAEKFWPVYNTNRDKIEETRRQFRASHDYKPEDIMQLSDEEANTFLADQIDHEQKMLNYRKAFNEQLKEILPPQKILILIEAEQEFKIELMKRIAGREGPPR